MFTLFTDPIFGFNLLIFNELHVNNRLFLIVYKIFLRF